MKKVLIIIITIGFIFTSGCAKSGRTPNISEQGSNKTNLDSNKIDATNMSNVTDSETVNNSFFFKSDILQLNYKGKFLFNEVVEKDIKLHINKVANLKYGNLYELKLDSIQAVPDERLNLGYFYVQKDKIYKTEPNEENLNKLKTSEEIPKDSVIVCQEKELKDTLNKDEPGWHHYIEVKGDKREYHSYNNLVSTGYYESFIWEKNKGLINYRSGYGAERDSIELQSSNN